MSEKSSNVVWHGSSVGREQRRRVYGHGSAALWFTGLSGSGKSTVAHRVEEMLVERGCFTYVLDGDNVRHGLNSDLGFSAEAREENIRRIGEVTRLFVDSGALTLAAFVSPFRKDRDRVREKLAAGDFIEVFVDTPLEVCEQRDPKGLYKKARAGEIPDFTGIHQPYEAPTQAEIVLKTAELDVDECADAVIRYLERRGVLQGG